MEKRVVLVPIRNGNLTTKFAEEYARIDNQIKALTEMQNEMKESLLRNMERNGIVSLENEMLKIKYIQPTTQERFDSKTFRQDHEDLYNEYVKFVEVRPQIRITKK